jgi:hypothetical protein
VLVKGIEYEGDFTIDDREGKKRMKAKRSFLATTFGSYIFVAACVKVLMPPYYAEKKYTLNATFITIRGLINNAKYSMP